MGETLPRTARTERGSIRHRVRHGTNSYCYGSGGPGSGSFCLIVKRSGEEELHVRSTPHVKTCSQRVLIPLFLFLTPFPSQISPLTLTPKHKNPCPSGLTVVGVRPSVAPCLGSQGRPRRALKLAPSVHPTQSRPLLAP